MSTHSLRGLRLGLGIVPRPFHGILDSIRTTPAACYSLRRLRLAYQGPLVRFRRTTDDAEKDFWANPDDPFGAINIDSVIEWLGAGNGFCRTWYDQSGNGLHGEQTVKADQPFLVTSHTANNLPTLSFGNAATTELRTAAFTLTQPNRYYSVCEFSADSGYVFDGIVTQQLAAANANKMLISGGIGLSGITNIVDSLPHQYTLTLNGISSEIKIDGTVDGAGNAGGGSLTGGMIIGNKFVAQRRGPAIFEHVCFDSLPSADDDATLENDQIDFYEI